VGVYLNNAKITSAFKETPAGSHMLQGLATGLRRGDNDLLIRDERNPSASNQVILTDYAITGPILSGPHITPYECRTTQNGLGAPLDADCSGATQISYYYRSTSITSTSWPGPRDPTRPIWLPRQRPMAGPSLTSCGWRPVRSIVACIASLS
jgi:hypothetical protein